MDLRIEKTFGRQQCANLLRCSTIQALQLAGIHVAVVLPAHDVEMIAQQRQVLLGNAELHTVGKLFGVRHLAQQTGAKQQRHTQTMRVVPQRQEQASDAPGHGRGKPQGNGDKAAAACGGRKQVYSLRTMTLPTE